MKHVLILSAAMLGLAACGGADNADDAMSRADTSFGEDCLVVANDARGQEDIGEMGTDPDGFCDCAEAIVADMSDADQDSARMTMKQVAAGMEDSGEATETVVGNMMSEAMAQGDDPDAQSVINGVQLIGRVIDEIDEGFSETGSCPAS